MNPALPATAVPRALQRAAYRTRQFLSGFRTVLTPAEVSSAREVLTLSQLMLFAAMEPRDRRHSMDVLHWLRTHAAGRPPSRELEAAALLHDVGKGGLWDVERVVFVLLEAVSPALVDAIGRADGPRWRQGLWRLRHHARLGAELLARAGSDPRVAALVAGHLELTPGDPELAWLREADRAC